MTDTDQQPQQFDRRAPCRLTTTTTESGLDGRCLRCRAAIGEACRDPRDDLIDLGVLKDGLKTTRKNDILRPLSKPFWFAVLPLGYAIF